MAKKNFKKVIARIHVKNTTLLTTLVIWQDVGILLSHIDSCYNKVVGVTVLLTQRNVNISTALHDFQHFSTMVFLCLF